MRHEGRTKTQTFSREHCYLGQAKGLQEALAFDPKCPLPLTKNPKVPIFRQFKLKSKCSISLENTIECLFLTGPLSAVSPVTPLPPGHDPHATQSAPESTHFFMRKRLMVFCFLITWTILRFR